MPSNGHVYAINYGNNTKIGYSAEPATRIKVIVSKYQLSDPLVFISDYHFLARDVETLVHNYLIESFIGEEWFDVGFKECIEVIKQTLNECLCWRDLSEIKKPRVTLTPRTMDLLNNICERRDSIHPLVSNKVRVLAELIEEAHKKECKS